MICILIAKKTNIPVELEIPLIEPREEEPQEQIQPQRERVQIDMRFELIMFFVDNRNKPAFIEEYKLEEYPSIFDWLNPYRCYKCLKLFDLIQSNEYNLEHSVISREFFQAERELNDLCDSIVFNYAGRTYTLEGIYKLLETKYQNKTLQNSMNLFEAIAYHSEGIIPEPKDLENFIKNKEKELENLEKEEINQFYENKNRLNEIKETIKEQKKIIQDITSKKFKDICEAKKKYLDAEYRKSNVDLIVGYNTQVIEAAIENKLKELNRAITIGAIFHGILLLFAIIAFIVYIIHLCLSSGNSTTSETNQQTTLEQQYELNNMF